MKRYKGLVQRLGALSLTLAMTAGSLVPAYGQTTDAGETADQTQSSAGEQGEETKETAAGADQKQDAESEKNQEKDKQQADSQKDQADSQENLTGENQKEDDADAQSGQNTLQAEDDSADQTAEEKSGAQRQADITAPVIEKVTFSQNGQTLKEGDTLEMLIDAYDTETEKGELDIFIGMRDEEGDPADMDVVYDASQDCYVATYKLDKVGNGQVHFTDIRVKDAAGNYVNACEDAFYGFTIAGVEQNTVKAKSLDFAQQGQTIKDNEEDLDLTVTLEESVSSLLFECLDVEFTNEVYVSLYSVDGGTTYRGGSTSYGGVSDKCVLESVTGSRLGEDLTVEIENPESCFFYHEATPIDDEESVQPMVTDFQMDKAGEIVRQGDQINFCVKTDSNARVKDIRVILWAVADVAYDTGSKSLDLSYDAKEDAFTGSLTVDDSFYPCEYYVYSIQVSTGVFAWTQQDWEQDYYVQVYDGDTFVNPTYQVTIRFQQLDENRVWNLTDPVTAEVTRRDTYKDAGIEFPEMKSAFEGVTQIGWKTDWSAQDDLISEDTEILGDVNETIYAVYDKIPVEVNYRYLTSEGTVAVKETSMALDPDSTYGALREVALEAAPGAAEQTAGFSGWECSVEDEESLLPVAGTILTVNAKYEEKKVILVSKSYYDEKGSWARTGIPDENNQGFMPLLVDADASVEEIKAILNQQELPRMFEGLRFSSWYIYGEEEWGESWSWANMGAVYENCMITFYIVPSPEEEGDSTGPKAFFCQAAELGETITVPRTLGKYQDITWTIPTNEDTFVVDGLEVYFYGYAGSIGEEPADPENPADPEEPTDPENPADPEEPTDPENPADPEEPVDPENPVELPEENVDAVISQIEEAQAGQSVQVDMKDATVVTKEMLEAAKGKDVNLVLNMGAYSWTINGKNIAAKNLKDINLEVTLDTNAIPSETVKKLAGDNPVRQLSLTYEGDFGFQATLSFNIGSQYAGQYGNLYYYDSNGRMVFINAGAIDKAGNVSLNFSHASDYAVVISKEKMSQSDVPEEIQPSQNSGESQGEAPATDDINPIAELTVVMLLAAGAAAAAALKLREQKQMK